MYIHHFMLFDIIFSICLLGYQNVYIKLNYSTLSEMKIPIIIILILFAALDDMSIFLLRKYHTPYIVGLKIPHPTFI